MNVTHLLSVMALEVHGLVSPAEALDRIGQYARHAVDADDSGVMLLEAGKVTTIDSTSLDVEEAHRSQVALNEGPCLDAVKSGASMYYCADTRTDPRWPTWGPVADALGYRSVISVRLETNGRKLGSLNAYAARPAAFTVTDEQTLEFLGSHAAVAIASLRRDQDLRLALDTRTVISQAQGMLMITFDISALQAFQYMKRVSQDSNRKLAVIAQQVVDDQHVLRSRIVDSPAS